MYPLSIKSDLKKKHTKNHKPLNSGFFKGGHGFAHPWSLFCYLILLYYFRLQVRESEKKLLSTQVFCFLNPASRKLAEQEGQAQVFPLQVETEHSKVLNVEEHSKISLLYRWQFSTFAPIIEISVVFFLFPLLF